MTLTTFVGVPFEVYHKFIEQEDAENKQLEAIAEKYDKRYERRDSKIASLESKIESLRREIERLEARQNQERRVWHNVMDRHIARNQRICDMFDELKEAKKNGYVEPIEPVEALPF